MDILEEFEIYRATKDQPKLKSKLKRIIIIQHYLQFNNKNTEQLTQRKP